MKVKLGLTPELETAQIVGRIGQLTTVNGNTVSFNFFVCVSEGLFIILQGNTERTCGSRKILFKIMYNRWCDA